MGKNLKAYDYLCCSCYPKLTGGEGSNGYASTIFQALIPSPCFTSWSGIYLRYWFREDRRFRAGIMEEAILWNTSCALCYSMFSLNLRMASHVGAAESVPTLLVRLPTMGKQSRKWTYPAFAGRWIFGESWIAMIIMKQWSLDQSDWFCSVWPGFLCSFQLWKIRSHLRKFVSGMAGTVLESWLSCLECTWPMLLFF